MAAGVAILFLGLLLSPVLGAATGADADLPSGGIGEAWLKMLGTLLLVVGLIVFVFYVAKRLRLAPLPGGKEVRMRLLGTLHLAPKRSVALVEVSGEWLVLGVGTESISLLSKLDRAHAAEGCGGPSGSERPSFEGLLRNRLFGSRGSSKGEGHEGA
jgi:flagellar biosynthetic protein FliO